MRCNKDGCCSACCWDGTMVLNKQWSAATNKTLKTPARSSYMPSHPVPETTRVPLFLLENQNKFIVQLERRTDLSTETTDNSVTAKLETRLERHKQPNEIKQSIKRIARCESKNNTCMPQRPRPAARWSHNQLLFFFLLLRAFWARNPHLERRCSWKRLSLNSCLQQAAHTLTTCTVLPCEDHVYRRRPHSCEDLWTNLNLGATSLPARLVHQDLHDRPTPAGDMIGRDLELCEQELRFSGPDARCPEESEVHPRCSSLCCLHVRHIGQWRDCCHSEAVCAKLLNK